MFFKIDSGLFQFDFTDHHAVLGVPIDADFKDIRKRYLNIARRLHPDSCFAESEAYKRQASQLLSKLVNPAYEKFSHDRSRAEYIVLLKEMGKRVVQESAAIELKSELSQQLNKTNNIDHFYKTLLYKLAEKQYESFDQVPQLIAQISELNLVYLMRKGGSALQPPLQPQSTKTNSGEKIKDTPPPPPAAQQESVVAQYLRRAQNFASARVELQEALKLEPNNSLCHSLIGVVYLKQNQNTMAKVHINKALQLNPQEPMALKGKQFLDQASKKSGGHMFGGMFGGKKK